MRLEVCDVKIHCDVSPHVRISIVERDIYLLTPSDHVVEGWGHELPPKLPTAVTQEIQNMVAVNVILVVPLTSNDGETFSEEHHHGFGRLLTDIGLDYSITTSPIMGTWQGVTESSRVYVFAVDSVLRSAGKILAAAEIAKSHYQQIAIFVTYLGVSEILS